MVDHIDLNDTKDQAIEWDPNWECFIFQPDNYGALFDILGAPVDMSHSRNNPDLSTATHERRPGASWFPNGKGETFWVIWMPRDHPMQENEAEAIEKLQSCAKPSISCEIIVVVP